MSKTKAAKQQLPADAKTGYATPDKPAAGEFANARIAIVATRWNVEIVDALVAGARAALKAGALPASMSSFSVHPALMRFRWPRSCCSTAASMALSHLAR